MRSSSFFRAPVKRGPPSREQEELHGCHPIQEESRRQAGRFLFAVPRRTHPPRPVAYSRLHTGAHWLSDVLGGVALGAAVAVVGKFLVPASAP